MGYTWETPVSGSTGAATVPSVGFPVVGWVKDRTRDLNGRSEEGCSDVPASPGADGPDGEVDVGGSVFWVSAATVPGRAVDASGMVCCSAATGADSN